MKSGIYKITINNKVYVGYAKDFEKRKNEHYRNLINEKHDNPYLQNAFLKYNEFKFEIIEECVTDIIGEREVYWIAELNTFKGEGYNLTDGGDTSSGKLRSAETRRKISEANKGRTISAETRRKMSESKKGENNPYFGKTHSAETRRKMSEAGKGNQNALGFKHSAETRKKVSEAIKGENHPNFGKTTSAETRRKISETSKGKTLSAETRKKISEAGKGNQKRLGKTHSAESRKKISEANKRYWAKRKNEEVI